MMTPKKIINENVPTAKVKIISEGGNAVVFLDGVKVNGVIGYEVIHDRTKTQIPVLRLNIQSELDIETGVIPELPEPWNLCYVLKSSVSNSQA